MGMIVPCIMHTKTLVHIIHGKIWYFLFDDGNLGWYSLKYGPRIPTKGRGRRKGDLSEATHTRKKAYVLGQNL